MIAASLKFVVCFALVLQLLQASIFAPKTTFNQNNVLRLKDQISSLNDSNKERIGVLLLNLGGPKTLQDVQGFLYNLFADPDIIRLPRALSLLQKPLAYLIARQRAPKSSEAYASIGGGSPIVQYTQAQADLIQQALSQRGLTDVKCYFAMRYWHPFTEDVLQQMRDDGVNRLVILPLYPHYSISTSGSSLKLLQQIFLRQPALWGPQKVAHTVVPSWYRRPGYIRAMARLVLRELAEFSQDEMRQGLHVLFSAHGVPESYIAAGDPYQRQIEECVRLVAKDVAELLRTDPGMYRAKDGSRISRQVGRMLAGPPSDTANSASVLYGVVDGSGDEAASQSSDSPADGASGDVRPVTYHLSFQSRVGPVQWLRPYTDDTLRRLGGERGVRNLVVVPVSFVSEHIETLEEIDMEYRELALRSGVARWRRVPALNTDELFVAEMADLVVEALAAPDVPLSAVLPDDRAFLARQADIEGRLEPHSSAAEASGGNSVSVPSAARRTAVLSVATVSCILLFLRAMPLLRI